MGVIDVERRSSGRAFFLVGALYGALILAAFAVLFL
jgi:hypothetical protein